MESFLKRKQTFIQFKGLPFILIVQLFENLFVTYPFFYEVMVIVDYR